MDVGDRATHTAMDGRQQNNAGAIVEEQLPRKPVSTIPRMELVEPSQEQRPRIMQDAYMEVSGRTTQETKSNSYRGETTTNLCVSARREFC